MKIIIECDQKECKEKDKVKEIMKQREMNKQKKKESKYQQLKNDFIGFLKIEGIEVEHRVRWNDWKTKEATNVLLQMVQENPSITFNDILLKYQKEKEKNKKNIDKLVSQRVLIEDIRGQLKVDWDKERSLKELNIEKRELTRRLQYTSKQFEEFIEKRGRERVDSIFWFVFIGFVLGIIVEKVL